MKRFILFALFSVSAFGQYMDVTVTLPDPSTQEWALSTTYKATSFPNTIAYIEAAPPVYGSFPERLRRAQQHDIGRRDHREWNARPLRDVLRHWSKRERGLRPDHFDQHNEPRAVQRAQDWDGDARSLCGLRSHGNRDSRNRGHHEGDGTRFSLRSP